MKILLRLASDITLKSDKIRARFVGRLLQNLKSGFRRGGVEATIQRQWSRLFVETDHPQAVDIIARTFGVGSCSPIDRECTAHLDAIVAHGLELFAGRVAAKTFAVRARRIGHHDFTSMDIMCQLGAALRPYATGVDLKHPQVEVFVEVREQAAYLYSKQISGPAGLPLGVSGRVLCLLSGGFDSAVAAWLMQKRGVEVEFLFCNVAGAAYERSVVTIAKFLAAQWGHGTRAKLHILDFQPMANHVRERVKPSYVQVVLKRLFYRAADHLAAKLGAYALVTGECIAQVSSQTLRNLCTIETASSRPVLRPVIGLDKEEILTFARRIGTYDLCAAVQEYCQLVPDKPVTACSVKRADSQESQLDPSYLQAALASHQTLLLDELSTADLVTPYLYTTHIPPGAVVIDCRSAEQYEAWHYQGARNIELHDLLTLYRSLDKGPVYILYCPVGLQSAVGAERLQRAGFQAYSFKGGAAALASFEQGGNDSD